MENYVCPRKTWKGEKTKPVNEEMKETKNKQLDENNTQSSEDEEKSTPKSSPKIPVPSSPKSSPKIPVPRKVYKLNDIGIEEDLLEWIQTEENDFLWNTRRTDYRLPDKKRARFQQKEKALNLEEGFLSKWFEGLRDQYTKLHKRKSGDGCPMFTERQEWVLRNLKFF
ncbi:unnamed protein product [Owenia fusiformis]|uniref:MADF domain-containing protein n=1 Tax=Owenia fusiformis TaxID=6347 RepID=A0A8S4ND88_OWEFU|nr:unnamed protein product [Owenia fusiformis]